MNHLPLALAILMSFASSITVFAGDHYVRGYPRKDGTQVQGHHRSDSNDTRNDNYSTRGNTNPYPGSSGTKPRDENRDGRHGSSHED